MKVSIILPVYNAEKWFTECLESILKQNYKGNLELCVYNDSSTDLSVDILKNFAEKFTRRNIQVVLTEGRNGETPNGCGFAKNRAVESSSGDYLCFLDADDVMEPERIKEQLTAAMETSEDTLIGSQVKREPDGSTARYTRWINSINRDQLYTQIYTSNGPTVVMPTWFCHRKVFENVGGFSEDGKGIPEDYIFFLQHLRTGGKLIRVDKVLIMYRHHPEATSASVSENTIWRIRLKEIQENVISKWRNFTVWNAGKQGRKFYRELDETNRKKVAAFCDVDTKKIKKGVYIYEESKVKTKPRIPIVHFTRAKKPFIICLKLDMTNGVFEKNLSSLDLVEGIDYFHFN